MKSPHRWAATALFAVASSASTLAQAVGTWESTLQGRDLDGNLATFEAYYDTALDITWLADANYAMTSGYDADGKMAWFGANVWATGLDPYGSGITGWRLPATIDADGPDADTLGNDGCNQTPSYYQGLDCGYNISVHSEMSYMFYVTMGNKAYYDTSGNAAQPGWGLTNSGRFSNIWDDLNFRNYWSTEYSDPDGIGAWAWTFHFNMGGQFTNFKFEDSYVWAVHDGDVGASPVPVPAAFWLFGSGLMALATVARRRKNFRII